MNYEAESLEFKEQADQSAKDGFQDWLQRPEVSALISLIPSSHGDILQTVLRSSYTAGHNAGQGLVMVKVLKEVFMKKSP